MKIFKLFKQAFLLFNKIQILFLIKMYASCNEQFFAFIVMNIQKSISNNSYFNAEGLWYFMEKNVSDQN